MYKRQAVVVALLLAPAAGGEPPARRWLAFIELATMRCPRYTLAPFADLAGFCGARAALAARLADPSAPVPPHTGEYRAALETLTDLTRAAAVGPPAQVFVRGSMVVDFFRNRPWPPALAGWPATYPDSLLDALGYGDGEAAAGRRAPAGSASSARGYLTSTSSSSGPPGV